MISDDLERKLLHEDIAKERESDEDGGAKTRVEMDSDFSLSEEEENAHFALAEEYEQAKADEKSGKENWSELLTKHRPKHNTGVKGVRADFNEAKSIVQRRNETSRLQKAEVYRRAAYGATTTEESVSFHSDKAKGLVGSHLNKYDADDEDDEDDEGDDEFLKAYRQQRVSQAVQLNRLPKYGHVLAIDKFGFLDEVDNADPRTFVVTHIYENYIAACRHMNDALEQVAQRHPHVKICKLIATEASQTLSHRALPAFLVYRDKEIVADSSVSVDENEFGTAHFGVQEVEYFLASRYGIEMAGVDVSAGERSQSQGAEGGLAGAGAGGDAWQATAQPTLGRVSLLNNRINKLTLDKGDDDDW